MSIKKFKVFEKSAPKKANRSYQHSYQSNDFTEKEEIQSILLDLNISGVTEIEIHSYWCDKSLDINYKPINTIITSCAYSMCKDFSTLDKLYSISIELNDLIFNDMDRYSEFSDDFFVAYNRMKDIGEIRVGAHGVDKKLLKGFEYDILLKISRK